MIVRWRESTSGELGELAAAGALVVIPVGAIEQHGPHLAVSTDADLAEFVIEAAAARLSTGEPIVVAPTVTYGFSHDHLGFPGTLSVSSRVLEDMLVEIGGSVLASGFSRIAFVNGHGSNDRLLYYVVRRIRDAATGPLAVAATTYWKLATKELGELRHSGEGGMGHACELETSLLMHFKPAAVRADLLTRDLPAPYSRFRGEDLLASGAVVAPDHFLERSDQGVSGDATLATAALGEAFAEAIAEELGGFLAEFAGWPLVQGGAA